MSSHFTDEHVEACRGQALALSLRDRLRQAGCGVNSSSECWAWLSSSWDRVQRLQFSLKVLGVGTPGRGQGVPGLAQERIK